VQRASVRTLRGLLGKKSSEASNTDTRVIGCAQWTVRVAVGTPTTTCSWHYGVRFSVEPSRLSGFVL